jgi:galactose mutarotase-like enzyme
MRNSGRDMTDSLLTLSHDGTSAAIAPQRGAIVTSFRVQDRELLYLDQATFDDRSKNVRGGIPLLFPSPGKLLDDRWKHGQMKQHGFARNVAWTVAAQTESQATLLLGASEETLRGFPWKFTARLTYTIAPSTLTLSFDIANEDSTPMPFAFGLHPYFVVHDKAHARIPTKATRAYDNVAKTIVPFGGFEFTQREVDLHLVDHGSAAAMLDLGDVTIAIDCSPELTRWVVWTLPGKDFICLEPWSAPGNALNTGEGLIVVPPGERHEMTVKFSVKG